MVVTTGKFVIMSRIKKMKPKTMHLKFCIIENQKKENFKQAEAEVVPSSSLIEVEVEVEVGVEVGADVEAGVDVEVDPIFLA